MLDYLRICGHRSLLDLPLNDVDRLVFAQLAYLDLRAAQGGQPLSQALQQAVFTNPAPPTEERFFFQHKDDRALRDLAAACPRYAEIIFEGFREEYSHTQQVQFASLSLRLPADTLLIAYRGTDNTLAGWKEDLNLAFMNEIPAQAEACRLADALAPGYVNLELCGHSKGGNLALYAAACMSPENQQKLRAAVSFDGPGLSMELITSAGYLRIADRTRLIIPSASLVGLLFHQPADVRVVESRVFSILQHYPYFWRTEGENFLFAHRQSKVSRTIGDTIRLTLDKLEPDMRRTLIDAVWEIVEVTGAETTKGLLRVWIRSTPAVLKKLLKTDPDIYRQALTLLIRFWLSAAQALTGDTTEE